MNLLAVDTSSSACSVALQVTDEVVERHIVEPKIHTSILIPTIREMLAEADLSVGALQSLVLGNGPGSFIGMRIGASVVQGMAYASDLGIVPVSSLAAIAAEEMVNEKSEFVAVAQDARMNEVYLGCYCRSPAGVPLALQPEAIHPAGKIVDLDRAEQSWICAGAGWRKCPELVEQNSGLSAELSAVQLPRARFLLPSARMMLENGEQIAPEQLQPAYLRQQVATPPTS